MSNGFEVYKRADGKWSFRIVAENGQIVATDGSQGYSRRVDAVRTASQLIPVSPDISPDDA